MPKNGRTAPPLRRSFALCPFAVGLTLTTAIACTDVYVIVMPAEAPPTPPPEKPEDANGPEEPEAPEEPEQPEQPEQPGEPEGPEQPEAPEEPTDVARPACLGAQAGLIAQSQVAYTEVRVGPDAVPGAFLVDFGATFSTIDIEAFDPALAPSSCRDDDPLDALEPGRSCTFDGFDFFGPWGSVELTLARYATIAGAVRQAGILGTDFLSVRPTTLDYADGTVFRGSPTAFCSDGDLEEAGFQPYSTAGFYSADLGTLRPMLEVDANDAEAEFPGLGVPNVPTLALRVAGVEAWGQLDTGFDDNLVPHSMNVNRALLDAVMAAAPDALVRTPSLDLQLSTCVPGVSENVAAYALAPGFAVEMIDETGAPTRPDPTAILFVKNTPTAARVCRGIGTWTVPAAQLAGSFLADEGIAIFDPIASKVWLPRR